MAHRYTTDVFDGKHRSVCPASVIAETAAGASRRYKAEGLKITHIARWIDDLLKCPNIAWKTVDRNFAYEAAMVGASHGLRGMDALIAATAIYYDLPIVTEDAEFSRLAPSVSIIRLRDLYS
jgi:predicted nucleic acid-binding protein